MRNLFLVIFVFCSTFCVVAGDNEPAKETSPDDTLKVYYLNEVVISSSVKETNALKSLPTAISVVSPKQLQDARIESLPRLSAFIPNFFIPSYGSKVSTPIYIRGVGARLGSQTVSLYVDNVPSFNPSAFDFEFQDIQRIEVLRGAQGTLYGRNAIGGIVNMYTLSPLSFQGTKLMVSGGNYGQFSAKGSDYRKLSDRFGLSLAGYYKRDDGYFMDSYTGKKVDASENAGGRFKLEWQASPSFKAMLFGNYDYVSGGAFPYMHEDSTASSFNEPSSYDRHLFTNGLSLDYTGNGFTIHSTTGFQYLKDDMKMDQDYSPKSVFSINQKQKQHSVSQEVTVKSDRRGNYRWVVGAFGFVDNREIDTPVALKEDMVAVLQQPLDRLMESIGAPLRLEYANDRIDLPGIYTKPSRGAALFHQSTFNNLFGVEGFSATAGIRFDYEHTGLDYFTESDGGDINMVFQTPMPIPPIFVEGDTLLEGSFRKDFWKILPKFALKYQMSPTSQVYLSASKGYKTGGYNEQVFSDVLQGALMESLIRNIKPYVPGNVQLPEMPPMAPIEGQLSYDPETSWTYELGGRYEMLDRRFSLTYALFYTHVNNLQITQLAKQGTSGRTIANAGKSESKGFELSLKYVPMDNLSLFAEYGFADARFVKYEIGEEGDDQIDYSGNHVPFAPQHTLSLGASYIHHLPYGSFIDRVIGNAQYQGVGKIYWTESNKNDADTEDLYQPFYGITNASIAVEKGAFGLECWVENLFNTKYNSFLFEQDDVTTDETNIFVQRGYPTRFGATLRYTFNR
ncbi:Outer membrane receptor proteins, mostly Fe transport [Porphyromonadaceae bacterium NLAE-zl-C104]|uniref:TonB-dependent receptor n=1 Tax=Proteiniphilum sp. TaxID=1926877 RepID=UPI00089D9D04|nr:TonB-dependent receptor [Proteiniphilum sp.]MDY9917648.1 TonB-dependent receptor [Proteiniphilum sp.]SEA09236.1 Outer membrane receptor proteins, mostly Fe transport [Porphyromonadaceae bacterium KH3R12]SFS32064.1 Outer membrane receptor proteins, mostly Fe transport [Porphyromonadaceae bacterium NLAE-zl-C104]